MSGPLQVSTPPAAGGNVPELFIHGVAAPQSTTSGTFVTIGALSIDPSRYPGATFTLEAILSCEAGASARIALVDVDAQTLDEVSGSASPAWPEVFGGAGGNLTVLDAMGFLRPSHTVYLIQLRRIGGAAETATCYAAWIRVHWPLG